MADAAQLNKKISKGGGDGVEVEGGQEAGKRRPAVDAEGASC